ncbi:MAG: alpha/beta fold hydrolase, partial [Rhizobacter sp.]|nr:alpha/beta fold hydrolase [Rhizobacter sp.]
MPRTDLPPFARSRRGRWATAAIAGAAATAAWVARRARRAERAQPPEGRILHLDGVRLHVVERGEGPPVVLIHGNLVTHRDFDASGIVERLARTHRVIAFDRPGYGHSSRPRDRLWTPSAQAALLHAALRRLGVERPVIVGHSW